MVKKIDKYRMSFAWVDVGDELNLKNFGYDERFTVKKIYWGTPRPEDTAPDQYDLSNLNAHDDCRSFGHQQRDPWNDTDLTLIVAPELGEQHIVFYIPDFRVEVDVYGDPLLPL